MIPTVATVVGAGIIIVIGGSACALIVLGVYKIAKFLRLVK